jgi:rhodanese-related sulfurtransferase
MSPEEVSVALRSERPPLLLDVRQPEEHAFAALSLSKLIPLDEIPGRLQEIEDWKARTVVVYCHHGVRSLHAAAYLRQSGFTDVRNLDGGIEAWSLCVDSSIPRY